MLEIYRDTIPVPPVTRPAYYISALSYLSAILICMITQCVLKAYTKEVDWIMGGIYLTFIPFASAFIETGLRLLIVPDREMLYAESVEMGKYTVSASFVMTVISVFLGLPLAINGWHSSLRWMSCLGNISLGAVRSFFTNVTGSTFFQILLCLAPLLIVNALAYWVAFQVSYNLYAFFVVYENHIGKHISATVFIMLGIGCSIFAGSMIYWLMNDFL